MSAVLRMLLVVAIVGCNNKSVSNGSSGDQPAATTAPPLRLKPPPDALETTSGLRSVVIRRGHGATHPQRHDRVRVRYSGWTRDGHVLSDTAGGRTRTLAVKDLFYGWSEGVRLMVVGEQRRFWIPLPLMIEGSWPAPSWFAAQRDVVLDVDLIDVYPGDGTTP